MKRLSIIVVLAFVLSATMASANPFSDVPFSHWAYDAVSKLAAKNLIQGYPDGTFKGEKPVTRYALAMVTAKMLANVEQMLEKGVGSNLVTKSDLQTLEKLTVEFADELALLGVKVTALEDDMQVVKEDVSTLKKDVEGIKDYMAKGGMEKVKLSGDMLVRHSSLIHKNDPFNANNTYTQSQLRFQFRANIDENITAVARWAMAEKQDQSVSNPYGLSATAWGTALNNVSAGNNQIDLAYLHIKDMFRFGGDFTFGRNFYATGHSLLVSQYVDAIRYNKRSGDVDIGLISVYDAPHLGDYKDNGPTNYHNVYGLTASTKYRDHDLYLNLFNQPDANLAARRFTLAGVSAPAGAANIPSQNLVAGNYKSDNLFALEFGGKGPLGKNGHWDYDLGFAYTSYDMTLANPNGNIISPKVNGWMTHVAFKWDSKKEWAAKLAYTMADQNSVGGIALNNNRRYEDGIETPYEDIARGNNYFDNGLLNMGDLKLQVEYRPRNTKHYFRLAGDFLNETKDIVTNELVRNAGGANTNAGIGVADLRNSLYDCWNNFGTADAKAGVFTFEYRYQLAENTRIRVGYTSFTFGGNALKNIANNGVSAGRGKGTMMDDYDYNMFWTEIYSRF
ncbi:MAG: S-layer homology domain-containing protein [Candidatus Riflebacteria bacterium]|nr:S-layer homology domain-containing protein [Candidatus Riflebacteria bacterium]